MIRTTTLALLLVLPTAAAAQNVHITSFAARDAGLRGSPALVGVSATTFSGPFGLRVGGAMDAPSTPLAPALGYGRSDAVQAWSGDVDMVLSGGRAGLRVAGMEPSVFTGFGVHGLRRTDGSTATIPVWNYGLGAARPLSRWLSVDLEARYRMPHESRSERLPAGLAGGWDLRAGLSLRLGSAHTAGARRPAASRRSATAAGPASRAGTMPVGAATAAALTIRTADRYVGVPYRWGGAAPSEGFDCSGFVQYVFAGSGVSLPRVSRDQARAGRWIPPDLSSLREGDLLFFATDRRVVDHVAIYVGDGTILHASASRGAVGYDRLDSRRGRWYVDHLVGARRVIDSGAG